MKFIAAALVLVPLAAAADPLADIALPLCSSIDAALAAPRGPTSSNCRAGLTDGHAARLSVTLDARQQAIDIGPYRINNAFLYNGKVVPEVWALDPGDTLAVTLSNNLCGRFGRITNLHTHGMIVSPKNASGMDDGGILGDNVFAFVNNGTPPPAGGEAMHHGAADGRHRGARHVGRAALSRRGHRTCMRSGDRALTPTQGP